ncbi:MAG: glycosyltransferase family 2 protein [Desulfocapsaceae bacterium]|nr:glycosyltransferase family 2 protein [Desulfocapsaceae bacterium]
MIDVIIPNWNGRTLLEGCLDSLQKQSSRCFRTIVVDNGSSDDSVLFIRQKYPWVDIVSLPENMGFSAAVNAGIRASDSTWVLLLNNDVEVEKGCLEYLTRICSGSEEYDFFALKMIDFHERSVIDGAGDCVLRGGVGYRLGTMETDGPIYRIRKDVFGACAGAALYRRTLFDSVGLFDETFFAYLEDVDLNLRAVRAGKKCCYLPDAVIYHIGSASTGSKINSFTVRLSTRNNIFVVLKNYGPLLFLRFLPSFLIYQFFWFLFVLKKRQFAAYLKGLGQSIRHVKIMAVHYKDNKRSSVLSGKDFGDCIVNSEHQAILSIIRRRAQHGKSSRLLQLYLKLFC